MRAKSSIILTLVAGPLSQVSAIDDNDDQSAKVLWNEWENLYNTSNAQAILNLLDELENLKFDEQGDFEVHLNKFHSILGKLASFEAHVREDEKASDCFALYPNHLHHLQWLVRI